MFMLNEPIKVAHLKKLAYQSMEMECKRTGKLLMFRSDFSK